MEIRKMHTIFCEKESLKKYYAINGLKRKINDNIFSQPRLGVEGSAGCLWQNSNFSQKSETGGSPKLTMQRNQQCQADRGEQCLQKDSCPGNLRGYNNQESEGDREVFKITTYKLFFKHTTFVLIGWSSKLWHNDTRLWTMNSTSMQWRWWKPPPETIFTSGW